MSHTKRIAVILQAGSVNIYILEGIGEYCRRHGQQVVCPNLNIEGAFPYIASWDGDGIIAGVTRELYPSIKRSRLSAVNITGSVPNMDIARVMSDHLAIGRMAAAHLLERGFKNFAYAGKLSYYAGSLRLEGFEAELRRHGLSCQVFDIGPIERAVGYNYIPGGRSQLSRWIRSLPKPTGLLAFDDGVALEVKYQALRAGVRIPEEVALIGVNDDKSLCELTLPGISSVHIPWDRVGYEAMVLLHRLMAGRRPPRQPILIEPTAVTVRQSTDTMAVEDLEIASALSFIRANAGRAIGVDDVVERANCCRRNLERRFQIVFDRTISKIIIEARLEFAKSQLAEMFKPVGVVARDCGFKTTSHFATVFRRELGLSPLQYRRQLLHRHT